jgi:hypothetical protein
MTTRNFKNQWYDETVDPKQMLEAFERASGKRLVFPIFCILIHGNSLSVAKYDIDQAGELIYQNLFEHQTTKTIQWPVHTFFIDVLGTAIKIHSNPEGG